MRRVVDHKLPAEVKKILATPEVAKRLADSGPEAVGSTPEERAAYQRAEITTWAKVSSRTLARRSSERRPRFKIMVPLPGYAALSRGTCSSGLAARPCF